MSQQRVWIEDVQPLVDGGVYPAKRTVGERVDVSASIFSDGHDHLRAEVCYKVDRDGTWRSVEMKHGMNDTWTASFYVTEKGSYHFYVQAWVDHFDTWFDGIRKKIAAKLDVGLELREGGEFLRKVGAADNELLTMAALLEDASQKVKAVELVLSAPFERLVHHHPLRQYLSRSNQDLEIRVDHHKALFSTWYELFPRSSSLVPGVHGTFRDTIKLLPRVAAMHFDVLYLPPIHPIGKLNRKGKNNSVSAKPGEPGSPWAIGSDEGGHMAVHPELGTLDDYKALQKEAAKYGIQLALDLAFQCAPDHPYVKEHPEWFRQRPDGSIQYAENPPKKYQDIYPFDFETASWKELWEELRSVIFYWIDNGITIFRVDNPHTKPFKFWEWVIAEVNKCYPDVIFLSEAFTRPKVMGALAKLGFTQSYTYFTWRVTKQEIMDYMTELTQGPSRNYFRPNFWPNTPDILPWHLQGQGENMFIIRYALASTLSASYGMYGPAYEFYENTPVEGKEEYLNSEKYEVRHYDWRKTNRMTDIITLVNKARKGNPALQSTWNLQFCAIENPNLIAYLKATDDLSNIILVIVNLDPHQRHSGYVQLPVQHLKLGNRINIKLHDLLTDEQYTWTQEWNYVELDPAKIPFHVLRLEVHDSQM